MRQESRSDRQTYMMKLTVAFRNFRQTPDKHKYLFMCFFPPSSDEQDSSNVASY